MYLSKFLCKRVIWATLFIFGSSTIAGAYTLVFYGGQRIEIPDNFTVTADAVIYEAAPGINVSHRLKSIDVAATERTNNDSSGSFLRRIGAEQGQADASKTVRKQATKTITNRDLEPYQRDRVNSETAFEKHQKEMGLPSREEIRQELARRDAALDDYLAKKRTEASENYWREREAELRASMSTRMNSTDYQGGPYYSGGIVPTDFGLFGPFDSRSRFGRGSFNLGSPCGFNPSPGCLLTHPFSLFNQGRLQLRRPIFVAPGTNGRHFRGGGVFVNPGRRH